MAWTDAGFVPRPERLEAIRKVVSVVKKEAVCYNG